MRWAESYCNMQFYMDSAKMDHKHIPYLHWHQHQSQEQLHGAPQPSGHWDRPPAQLCCAEVAPEHSRAWKATRQCWACFLSHDQGKLHSLARSCSVPGIPASSQFNPFCSWATLPSVPDHSSLMNCHCWAVTIRISPSLATLAQYWAQWPFISQGRPHSMLYHQHACFGIWSKMLQWAAPSRAAAYYLLGRWCQSFSNRRIFLFFFSKKGLLCSSPLCDLPSLNADLGFVTNSRWIFWTASSDAAGSTSLCSILPQSLAKV